MGAIELRPPARQPGADPPTAVQLADLVLAARLTVGGELASDGTARAALQQLVEVGTSAGGARAKAVVAFDPVTFQVRSAYAPPAPGFEQWLVKLVEDAALARANAKQSPKLRPAACPLALPKSR